MNLFRKTGFIGGIGEKALAVDDREQRIKNTPLRFTVRLQKSITEIEAIAEVGTHLAGRKPFVIILTEIGIARIALDAAGTFQPGLYEVQDGVLQGDGADDMQ